MAAIVGPLTSSAMELSNAVSSEFGIPQFAYSAMDPFLVKDSEQSRTLFRMTSSSRRQSSALIALIKHFEWETVAILTSSSDYGKSVIHLCSTRLAH